MDDKILRMLISEMVAEAIEELEEEELDEFSGAGAIAGYTLPLGMEPKVKKSKKLGEAVAMAGAVMPADSASIGGFDDHLPKKNNNNKRINFRTPEEAIEDYETSVEKLAQSFGGSESPFGKRGASSHKRVIQFLTPKV